MQSITGFAQDFFFLGTFAPALRASDRPIAIACLRLLTVLPDRPLLSVPRLRSCIARFTFADAFLPYFRGIDAPCIGLQAKIAAAEIRRSAPSFSQLPLSANPAGRMLERASARFSWKNLLWET